MRGPLVRIEVCDTGIGMTPDQQQHIFEEFYQGAGAPDLGSKGLGLGLAIVERLAKLLGLPLHVRSIAGKGSVFAIEIPLAGVEMDGAPPLHLPLSTRFEALPVLLIDDDRGAREATAGILAQWGCDVRSAAGGADAVTLLSDGLRPRLIICDYRLGENELGTDVVQQIRALFENEIPAVIISADSTQELGGMTAAAGLHFLHKPLNAARLRALLIHVTGQAVTA
jgi:signal transduction histidine kinase